MTILATAADGSGVSGSKEITVKATDSSSSGSSLKLSLKNTSKGVKLSWKEVDDASGYYIYRKTSSGSYKKIKTIKSSSTVSYTDTSVKKKNGTTYTYKVESYTDSGTGVYASKKTVRLTAPKLSSVKNATESSSTSGQWLSVKWKTNSSATGYQIQYATSKSFSNGKKSVTVKDGTATEKVIKGLKKGKTYYVRIRTYKTDSGKKYYSAWSSIKSVSIN